MAATPERIELEICRRSSEAELQEEPEEVSEEVLNRFNLSGAKTRSSSESEMEEVEEEEERGGCGTSEETRSRETLKLYVRVEEEEEDEGSEVESSDEVELSPHSSDTPMDPDSTSSTPSPVTSPPAPTITPSTASFVTTPDFANSEDGVRALPTPTVVMESCADGGQGSFHDITPELPQKRTLLQQEMREESDEEEEENSERVKMRGRRRQRGAHSLPPCLLFPPLQPGGGALLLLKGLGEAPPPGQVEVGRGGARSLLTAVFSGHKKEQKRKGVGTLPAKRGKKEMAKQKRFTDVSAEVSDLDSSTVLQRCSQKPRNNLRLELLDLTKEIQRVDLKEEENQELAYVPHALAFKRSYAIKRHSLKDQVPLQDSDGQSSCPTEVVGVLVQPKEASSLSMKETLFLKEHEDENEDLDTKITRRVQRAVRRQAKQEELKRLHKAQMIQRQLQQVEEKQRQLEERGVIVEKALRGEADYWGDSSHSADMELHLGGLGKLGNPALMQQWFQLVQQKNALVRYEAELMIFARELELEDRQSRLQQELRERMAVDDHLKNEEQLAEERLILEEMLEVVEQRDSLVSLLEEQRLQERQEDQDLEQVMLSGGLGLTWT